MHIRKQILGVNVDYGWSYPEVISFIEQLIQAKTPGHYVCTTNPEFIIDAQTDSLFRDIINKADLSVPDGSGLLYAHKYLEAVSELSKDNKLLYLLKSFASGVRTGMSLTKNSSQLHATITGVDITDRLSQLSSQKNYSMYLLGGRFGPEVTDMSRDMAQETKQALEKKYPGINIIGATSKFNRTEADDLATVDYIKKDMQLKGVDHIDILLVAYNHGYQDKWIVRNAYKIPATVSIGIGRTFDLISGYREKEPNYIEKLNLGWLYRLITQPSRFNRIFKAFPLFPLKVYINSIKD